MFRRRLAVSLVSALAVAGTLVAGASPAGAVQSPRWVKSDNPGGWFAWSSPSIADINGDGSNDVVVGGQDGKVYAWDANGNRLPGWPATAIAAVASSPAVADVDGDGRNEVVVGAGSLDVDNQQGGVMIFNRDGSTRCAFKPAPLPDLRSTAVFNAPAIGDVDGDGQNDIVFGAFNQSIYVIGGNCNEKARFNNTDSVWSAPALADVDHDGAQEIFIGGDATASSIGLAHSGGYFRSLAVQNGQLVQRWVRLADETFQNAGAIGDIDGDGRLEVVTGTGSDYCRNTDPTPARCEESRKVWAFHLDDGSDVPGWPKKATFTTFLAAPALGDIDGDGKTDVVVGSTDYKASPLRGAIDAFLGNGGTAHRDYADEIIAPPVIADVNGQGPSEVIVGTYRVWVLDGALSPVSGLQDLAGGNGALAHKSAAAVGQLGSKWALVSTGFDPGDGNRGWVYAYDIPTPKATPWPQFRKNAPRLGAEPTNPNPCSGGYWLVASDGGIFSFGNAAFHGSTGNVKLNQPIVGMSATPSHQGYRFVARDGGIFSFGDAGFYGSTGNIRLNQPIVGMATTPSGGGYWLVAADGGIFAFGNAHFFGSTGNIHLNKPIVGMTPTKTGNGYWLVASDGGIFAFGDAAFFGSTGNIKLNQPIVAMAATKSGNGYWFVARDGGIFAYGDAAFFGSTGGVPLPNPIVSMTATPNGQGYWFSGAGGSVYSFGDAGFCGSVGGTKLNLPNVGMA
jgi:FG-GAP-like repeat/FG-GAP repeat